MFQKNSSQCIFTAKSKISNFMVLWHRLRKRQNFWLGSTPKHTLFLVRFIQSSIKNAYKMISNHLCKYFDHDVHIMHARVEFYRCHHKLNQLYKNWVAELWSIVGTWRFRCPSEECMCSLVDENIRDTIILLTPHKNFQAALLQQKILPLDQVIDIAESMILTSKIIKAIEDVEETLTVNKISKSLTPLKKRENGRWKSYKLCFISNDRKDFTHFTITCRKCNKVSHLH